MHKYQHGDGRNMKKRDDVTLGKELHNNLLSDLREKEMNEECDAELRRKIPRRSDEILDTDIRLTTLENQCRILMTNSAEIYREKESEISKMKNLVSQKIPLAALTID